MQYVINLTDIPISFGRDTWSVNSQQPLAVKRFMFPGGEPHIKFLIHVDRANVKSFLIISNCSDMNKVFELLLTVDVLKREYPGIPIRCFLTWIPFARQDRFTGHDEPVSIKVFSNIINSCGFERVYLLDPHSDVSPALINNSFEVTHASIINKVLPLKDFVIVCPDQGSVKRVHNLIGLLNVRYFRSITENDIIYCSKMRDTVTGKLSNFKVEWKTEIPYANKDLYILDDICDGGGTFVGLAKELHKLGPKSLNLFVTHGIFSKGFKELSEYFDDIHCTNSYQNTMIKYGERDKNCISFSFVQHNVGELIHAM